MRKTPHRLCLLLLFYLMGIYSDWEILSILCLFVLLHLVGIFIAKNSPSYEPDTFVLSNADLFWLRKTPHRVWLLLLFDLMGIGLDWEKFPIKWLFIFLHLVWIFIEKNSPSCISAPLILSNGNRFSLREIPHHVLICFIASPGAFYWEKLPIVYICSF